MDKRASNEAEKGEEEPGRPCHKVIDDARMKQINAGQADSRHIGFRER